MDQSEALTGTVTKLLKQLHTGDEVVVQQIFDYYFQRLAERARLFLASGNTRVSDEEDLASLVMAAFLSDAKDGEIGELRSRHDVWRMLSTRIKYRAFNLNKKEYRKKTKEQGESVFRAIDGGWDPLGIQHQPDRGADEIEALHRELKEELRNELELKIVECLLDGDSVTEIAHKVDKSPTTIYLKLRKIKKRWSRLNQR
jgi:hypothetical protein